MSTSGRISVIQPMLFIGALNGSESGSFPKFNWVSASR